MKKQFNLGHIRHIDVTIANGAQTSSEANLGNAELVGIHLPAAFTGVALTFTAAKTPGGTFQGVYNSTGQVSYTVAQGRYYAINPQDFRGVENLKIVSGSAEAAARTVTLIVKDIA
jgi:hypothetical protein